MFKNENTAKKVKKGTKNICMTSTKFSLYFLESRYMHKKKPKTVPKSENPGKIYTIKKLRTVKANAGFSVIKNVKRPNANPKQSDKKSMSMILSSLNELLCNSLHKKKSDTINDIASNKPYPNVLRRGNVLGTNFNS